MLKSPFSPFHSPIPLRHLGFQISHRRTANMAAGSKSNAPKPRKRVEAGSSADPPASTTLVRNKDGSAFAKCEECKKDVPMALISFHSCSLDAKIKMNLESIVVELPAEAKKKPAERKKPTSTEPKAKRLKKGGEKEKDPNAPKRPATAFFVFMEDFRKSFKEANPNAKGVKEVAKEGGEKWRSLTDEEKKPYIDKAAELKADYEKAMVTYNEERENDNTNEDDENVNEEGSEKEEDAEKAEEEKDVKPEAEEKEDAKKEEDEENLDDY